MPPIRSLVVVSTDNLLKTDPTITFTPVCDLQSRTPYRSICNPAYAPKRLFPVNGTNNN